MTSSIFKKTNLGVVLLTVFLLPALLFPVISDAQQLVYECNSGAPGECTFDDLITAVKRLTDWGTVFAIGFSVIVIAWAGIRYILSGGNPGERTKATNMLLSVVKGIVIIIAAWGIVRLILTGLGVNLAGVDFIR